jgi:hypothetical protein
MEAVAWASNCLELLELNIELGMGKAKTNVFRRSHSHSLGELAAYRDGTGRSWGRRSLKGQDKLNRP